MGTATLTIRPPSQEWKKWLARLLGWCQRSIKVTGNRRPLQIQQTSMIGNKGTLALVSVEGERVLVGVTNGCIRFHPVQGAAALDLPLKGTVR